MTTQHTIEPAPQIAAPEDEAFVQVLAEHAQHITPGAQALREARAAAEKANQQPWNNFVHDIPNLPPQPPEVRVSRVKNALNQLRDKIFPLP